MKRISTVAQRLKEYREENDLTLADLEKKTGIPAQTLNRYELAQRIPKIDMAVEIAEKLGINPLWLQGYDVNEKTALDSKGDFNDPLIEQIMELVLQMSPEERRLYLENLKTLRQLQEQGHKPNSEN